MKNKLEPLYTSQLDTFELAHDNYSRLKNVIYRTIPFDGFDIRIQFNPDRMISTTAKIDTATLKERKCFLCPENLPIQQKAFPYNREYNIFINPYPIFNKHFTVPTTSHTPQKIDGRFTDMLDLAFDFPDYTLFYNGPQCGASAPDHFHFQMAPRRVMPIEKDVENEELKQILVQQDFYSIATLNNYLRKIIILKTSDRQILSRLFRQITSLIGQRTPFTQEPMLNLLAWFDNCQWTICILPRKQGRPWQFFAEGEDHILFSPGCVDMAGLIIAPREKDFEKYNATLLAGLFEQVTITNDAWENIKQLTENFNT